jgi:hypothetical protein
MEHAHGFAATGQASLYLKKLCRHFSHKLETQFDDHNGVIRFPFGTCELSADEQALHLHCQAGSNDLERLRAGDLALALKPRLIPAGATAPARCT